MTRGDRAQLVLLGAAVVAVALAPVVVSYLQLGYHADVRAGGEFQDPAGDGVGLLDRAVHAAAADARGLPWERRRAVADAVRGDLEPRLAALEGSRVADGVAYRVRYNGSAARSRAARCPSGPGRTFGPCEVHGGVVVQERAGETTVIAVAFDLTVEHRRGTTHLTVVVDPV